MPGSNNFVTAHQWPGQFNTADVMLQETIIPLGQLCNADKSARIKFTIQDRHGHVFNEAITTIDQMASGTANLDAGNGTTFQINNL